VPSAKPITRLLLEWRGGRAEALDELVPLVYEELHRMARRYMDGERLHHTLQTTALVHEAYTRLVSVDVPWKDRVHFFAVAARAMRRILVDHARARGREKRGGGEVRLSLDDALLVAPEPSDDLVALDEALTRLASIDERKSQAVELHYFGGLTYDEIAAVLGVAPVTVERDLRLARAWLYSSLAGESKPS
jgi:RNA polymerase sigma factor (TIGR02999 family)